MKYYIKNDNLWMLNDYPEYDLKLGVIANLNGRGSMKVSDWPRGWVFDCDDDGLGTMLMLQYGFGITSITEDEFKQLDNNKIVFFSKERTIQLRSSIPYAVEWSK